MVAVDANGTIVRDRMIELESDNEMVIKGSHKFIESLLEDEDFYKTYIKEDNTPGVKGFH